MKIANLQRLTKWILQLKFHGFRNLADMKYQLLLCRRISHKYFFFSLFFSTDNGKTSFISVFLNLSVSFKKQVKAIFRIIRIYVKDSDVLVVLKVFITIKN